MDLFPGLNSRQGGTGDAGPGNREEKALVVSSLRPLLVSLSLGRYWRWAGEAAHLAAPLARGQGHGCDTGPIGTCTCAADKLVGVM